MARLLRTYGVSRLHPPPTIIGAGVAFHGPGVRLTTPFNPSDLRFRRSFYRLEPPTVVNQVAVFVASPLKVQLTDIEDRGAHNQKQRHAIWKLNQPVAIDLSPQTKYLKVVLTDIKDRAVHSLRQRQAKSRLAPPVVVSPILARPIDATLAPQKRGVPKSLLRPMGPAAVVYAPIDVSLVRIRPVHTTGQLNPPEVVGAGIAFHGPGVRLTAPISANDLLPRQAKSRLGKPILQASTFVASPIIVRLAPSARQGRKATYDLAGPFVINAPPRAKGRTATQFVQTPRIPTISRLFPPAVVTEAATATYSGPLVTLALSRAGKAKPRLLPVPVAFQPFRPAIISLSYAPTRAQAKSHLSAPTVVAPVLARRILVTLAPQKRGVPKSALHAPVVVGPVLARPIDTTLIRIRPVRTIWVLRKPTDLVDQQDIGTIKTHLAYSLRGRPKSLLSKPAVVAPVLARQIEVTLVRIRPVRTIWILRRPADLVDREDLGAVRVHLAYSVRGVPKSVLRPPVVVAPVLARAILTKFVAIRPPHTISILRRPTDLVDQADLGFIRVYLAPSFRGQPKSRLLAPTVVAPVLARSIETTFARILPVRTNPVLRKPVDLIDQQDLGFVKTHLVKIRPVKTVALLRSPVVIDLSPQTFFVTVTLAPSRFPTPKSILREPPKTTPQPAPIYPLFITLAPQSRGKAKPFLRATIYAAKSYAPVLVTLAPSTFPRPKSILRKPVVVAPVLARAIRVELAPQRRGVAKPFLREVVYGAKSYAPIRVTLAASPRLARAVHSRLSAPTVVESFVAQPIVVTFAPSHRPKLGFFITRTPLVRASFVATPVKVTLARIVPPKRFYLLSPPAVVGAGVTFRGLDVALAYSRRGKAMYRLTLTRAQIIECFGVVVGTDFAATVCGTTSAATVQGVTSAATVDGTTSAATVEGTTSSRGTVSGGDTQREGCE